MKIQATALLNMTPQQILVFSSQGSKDEDTVENNVPEQQTESQTEID